VGYNAGDTGTEDWFAETFTLWGKLFGPAEPQPSYESLFEKDDVVQPAPWMTVTGKRAGIDLVAHHAEDFTAEGVINIGNVRPLIPISIEGPAHAEYREISTPPVVEVPEEMRDAAYAGAENCPERVIACIEL
jgi:hypothetical protein